MTFQGQPLYCQQFSGCMFSLQDVEWIKICMLVEHSRSPMLLYYPELSIMKSHGLRPPNMQQVTVLWEHAKCTEATWVCVTLLQVSLGSQVLKCYVYFQQRLWVMDFA